VAVRGRNRPRRARSDRDDPHAAAALGETISTPTRSQGSCPFHGDCWEGLAAGPAIEARWGRPPRELGTDESVWRLEARYIALGLVNVVAVPSPERVVLGGGVMEVPGLLALVRADVDALLAGYTATEIVPPALGPLSGVLGAIALSAQRSTVTSVPIGVYGHTFAAASRGSSTQPRLCGVPKEARLNAWIPSPPLK
jgi:ROK family